MISAWCLQRPDWRKYTNRVKGIEWVLLLMLGCYDVNLLSMGGSRFQRTTVFFHLPAAFFFPLTHTGMGRSRKKQELINLCFYSCSSTIGVAPWDLHLHRNGQSFPLLPVGVGQSAVLHDLSYFSNWQRLRTFMKLILLSLNQNMVFHWF